MPLGRSGEVPLALQHASPLRGSSRKGCGTRHAGPRRAPTEGGHGAAARPGEETATRVGDCRLFCKPSALAHALVGAFRHSAELDARHWLWKGWPSLQTAVQLLWPPGRPLAISREHLQLPDGGIVALDWVGAPPGRAGAPHVLLIVPGAAGQVTRGIRQLCRLALREGCFPAVFNRRGHNGCPLTTPRLQPFGDPADLREAVAYVRFRHPSAPLFAVSEGSGSGLLLSYLGEHGASSGLAGAACVSPVLRARAWFEAGTPWWHEWISLALQRRQISRYAEALRGAVDVDRALGSRSLRALEEALFCHAGSPGATWEAYWERNEPLRDADEVAVPVLCLCSADDPVRGPPGATLPWELFQSSPYLFLLLSPHGGHCGFLGRRLGESWGNPVALRFLRAVLEFLRLEEQPEERPGRRSSALPHRRWRGTLPSAGAGPPSPESFSWHRSYTR
ncbi:Protein ABHD15 [Varanus komodoensis]|nr:Protein ABHD15 [Varanus komodoensis]